MKRPPELLITGLDRRAGRLWGFCSSSGFGHVGSLGDPVPVGYTE